VAERASDGGAVTLVEIDGAIHLWSHFVPQAPESQAAMQKAGRFLADGLDAASAA